MLDIYLKVGAKIRFYRKLNHFTQEQLGEILDIDQSYLGRIERGEINITLETLSKLANALHVTPAQLLDTSEQKENSKEQLIIKMNFLLNSLNDMELDKFYLILEEIINFKHI